MRIVGTKPLVALRKAAKSRIDEAAERTRLLYVTPGAAQQLVYEQKRREAEMILLDPTPLPENYPMLAAEVGITGATLLGVAEVVRSMAGAWLTAAATIESLRLGAKAAIDAATSEASILAAEAVVWPAPE